MANLDVALRLRLINGLKAPSAEAKRDLAELRAEAQRLHGVRASGLATDLGRIATAGGRADDALRRAAGNRSGLAATGTAAARLGNDLGTVAGRAGQADAAMKRLGAERAGLVTAGTAATRLGGSLDALAGRSGRADVALAKLGTERAGLVATGTASARLGADLSRLTGAADRTDAALRRLGAERAGLASGTAAVSRLGNDLRSLERAAVRADGALDRLGAARSGLATAGSATAQLSGELAGAARNAGRLADNLTRATTVVPRIRAPRVEEPAPGPWGARPSGPAPAHPRPVRPATRPHAPLAPEDEQRVRAAAGTQGTIVALGRGAMTAAGGIYVARAAIRATVGEAISFEKAWAEVVKKVNDAPNPEAMQQLQRTVAKTAIELGLSRNGLAEMTAEAGAAGIKFQDLERYVRLAAKASGGWDMAPREASQTLAEIKSAGQFSIAELDTLADKINALGDNSAAREADIVKMFQTAAEGARMAGSGMDTTLATLAALTALKSGGMQADVAARFYGAFTSKLRTAGGEGKGAEKVNDALEEIGLNGKKVAQTMARNADEAITDVLTRLAKHADPVKVAQGLMGQEWWDELARFGGGSLAEFKKQLEFLRDPTNYKGSLAKNLDAQLSTTANHLERLKALSGDVGDRLGRWALPGINRAIEGAIRQVDELDRRRALANSEVRARGEDPEKENAASWMYTPGGMYKKAAEGFDWAKDKALDHFIAPLPTQDPSRAIVEKRAQEARDEKELADKSRVEAKRLEERAVGTKDKETRKILLEQALRERETAVRRDARAAEAMRSGAGPAGARDMTDVEFGEVAARVSIETKRRIAAMERGLGAGKPNVVIPGTGIVMSRQAAEAELLALRKRFEALGGPPAEPQAPAPVPAAPPAPVMTVPLPPARPGVAAPATPLPPARPASLTPPATPARPEPTVQPEPTIQPAPTVQPQPTIQPAPTAQPQASVPAQPAAQAAPAVGVGGSEAAGSIVALQQRIGLLERALAGSSQANVRIPDTGIITARRGVEAEIAALRQRVESQRPVPAVSLPERPAAVPAPASMPAPAPAVVQPVVPPPAVQPPAAPASTVAPAQSRPAATLAAVPAVAGEAAGGIVALQQRIGLLERALAGSSQANVRIPDTGIITARRGVEAEIAALRQRVESQRPAPAASLPERPATAAPAPRPASSTAGPSAPAASPGDALPRAGRPVAPSGDVTPRVDPQPALDGIRAVEEGAKRLKTTMGQDLSGPARESMQSYTVALKAGTAEAMAAVTAAAAQMKAALSFNASPTITPRLVAPSGGGAAPAGGAPAARAATSTGAAPSAPASPAPRIQSASLRQGRGQSGPVFTGPIHVHGVQNVASLHRQISRAADRRARDARDGALHDTGVESA